MVVTLNLIPAIVLALNPGITVPLNPAIGIFGVNSVSLLEKIPIKVPLL